MTVAVLAEKPSVARDIARVLGATHRRDGVLVGNGYAVTWALGHLVALAEPQQMRPQWKRWQLRELPMIPESWPLEVTRETRDRFQIVSRLLREPDVEEVICATDAGREGELIFRYIYEAAGTRKPVKRLWVSSLTEDAIREGFANLRDATEYDHLADAARGRSRADWLVGMNLSRAYTLAGGETLSVGRVQTPTLAMLVERALAIRDFVAEPYREVVARFQPADDSSARAGTSAAALPSYQGVYFRPPPAARPAPSEAPARAPEQDVESDPSSAEEATLARRLPADGDEADRIVARALVGRAEIESVDSRQRRLPAPLLYDLTELQRHANRLFGYSARKTLDVAQSLYESKKLLSYPRTDSRHLSASVAAELGKVVAAISHRYAELLAPGTGERALGRRHVDDGRVSDHHAIIPTTTRAEGLSLSQAETRIYDLVCRRLLAAWHADHVYSTTTLITAVRNPAEAPGGAAAEAEEIVDRYRSSGTSVDREGWKVLDVKLRPASGGSRREAPRETGGEPQLPPGLRAGHAVRVLEAKSLARATRPPRHFTDSTLLTGMETAGRSLDDRQLSDAMRATGLGTPATRASIIETLIARGYAERSKKSLIATDKGIALIAVVHPDVRSPRMTGEWEARLRAIEGGHGTLAAFMQQIEEYVRDVVQRVAGKAENPEGQEGPDRRSQDRRESRAAAGAAALPEAHGAPAGPGPEPAWLDEAPPPEDEGPPAPEPEADWSGPLPEDRPVAAGPQQLRLDAAARAGDARPESTPRRSAATRRQPTAAAELDALLQREFGFTRFRPHQQAVCAAVVEGRDALLVMPTGAGKSLCYQLPGIARAGTTLVVSPLIALMEDQVAKLRAQGFAAERIHSGRKRGDSRSVSNAYLAGELDFLFIAPERLGIPGFPELLARRKPELVAIDEAHCISQWGHDFRPDYRMLGERLPLLRPAPIIALTATATPLVQRDILVQLGIHDAERHIHGFRRDNIFIELVELRPGARTAAALELLAKPERRPAIVYAPTRKKAEELAERLARQVPAAVYHAGISAERRDRVQAQFQSGQLEVMVATIAFGMGIDKPDVRSVVHTALPASVEGYYQEIGRAGRDGLPSRAVLFHSYADRRTHEWFLERDYPDPEVLRRIAAALSTSPQPRANLERHLRMDPEVIEKALEKLWIHGGARVDADDRVACLPGDWETPYREQRRHKREQLDQISRFAESRSCHMLQLISHFGDQADSGEPCGHCASCVPQASVALEERPVSPEERSAMLQILEALRERNGQSKGKLHRLLFGENLDRRSFEHLLGGLFRAGLVTERADCFENEGKTIHFQRLHLTDAGQHPQEQALEHLRVAEQPRRTRSGGASRSPRKKASGRTGVRKHGRSATSASAAAAPPALVEALRSWRLAEARRRRCPAFRILTDRALMGIAAAIPRDEEGLLDVHGMGPTLVRKYGAEILRITNER